MQESLPQHHIVLLGAGHTNAQIIRKWRMHSLRDVQLTCVSDFGVATYSGMLPGTLARQYTRSAMQIDLVRLCASAGVCLVREEVTGLDVANQELQLAGRPPLRYDALSIGVGSVPTTVLGASDFALAIKPMQTFLSRLDARLDQLTESISDRPWRIAIAGAGAAGIEIALCLLRRISQVYGIVPEVTLVDRSDQILKGMPARTRKLAERELDSRGVQRLLHCEIVAVDDAGRVTLDDGRLLESDLLLWATSAGSPRVLGRLGLPTDSKGFLLTRATLQSTGSDAVFAVGDTGTCVDHPRPKAGVYAVRQGPVLWENLQRQLFNRPLLEWKPQPSFLSLLNTGDGRAILTYHGLSVHARWCWKLKDWIDRRFLAKYQDYRSSMPTLALPSSDQDLPRYCGGCGSKVAANVLARVLRKLDNPTLPHVLVGLDRPDDVAVLQLAEGTAVAATADFFTAFLEDPHLLGRIGALNALSDMLAKGAKSLGALALVTVPHGPESQQELYLLQLLDGSLRELRAAGVPLVGGHTIEAAQATLGFTLLGEVDPCRMARKGCLRAGDRLVLTKPLGTGILLAGHMRAMCRSDWMDALLNSMLTSNQGAATIVAQQRLEAVTDVTGFGLVGHMLEMLRASGFSAELSLGRVPLLPGVLELAGQGVESTLAPANRAEEAHLLRDEPIGRDPRYAALFDPQTSGGLLMGVAEEQLDTLLDRLGGSSVAIGRVVPAEAGQSSVRIMA